MPRPGQQTDRRFVDAGRKHGLRAARQHGDTTVAPGASAGEGRRSPAWRSGQAPRPAPAPAWRRMRFSAGHGANIAGQGPRKQAPNKRQPEPRWIGQDEGQQRADQPVGERALVGLLDVGARMVDQVHVVDAGRAGRHAGEAGQAAVDMPDDLLVGRTIVFQHVLDQIDAAARLNRARRQAAR